GVGEQLLAHVLDPLLRFGGIAGVEVELDDLPQPHVLHLAEPQRAEGASHRLPLRVEHRLLQSDHDARLHATPSGGAHRNASGPRIQAALTSRKKRPIGAARPGGYDWRPMLELLAAGAAL